MIAPSELMFPDPWRVNPLPGCFDHVEVELAAWGVVSFLAAQPADTWRPVCMAEILAHGPVCNRLLSNPFIDPFKGWDQLVERGWLVGSSSGNVEVTDEFVRRCAGPMARVFLSRLARVLHLAGGAS